MSPAGADAKTIHARNGVKSGSAAVTVSNTMNPPVPITITSPGEDVVNTIAAYNADNGGSGSMNSVTVDDDTDYTAADSSFTREGYRFTGWNTKADGSGTSYSSGPVIKNVQNDITLYTYIYVYRL